MGHTLAIWSVQFMAGGFLEGRHSAVLLFSFPISQPMSARQYFKGSDLQSIAAPRWISCQAPAVVKQTRTVTAKTEEKKVLPVAIRIFL